jgi:hypothetical protein
VFGLMFFVSEYRWGMQKNMDALIQSAQSKELQEYYEDYKLTLENGAPFDVYAEIPAGIKSEMIMYYAKNAVQLSKENYLHFMRKITEGCKL